MSLLVEWVYAFPPGDRARMDTAREYMVAACKGEHHTGTMQSTTT